jgi:hypothetical protein
MSNNAKTSLLVVEAHLLNYWKIWNFYTKTLTIGGTIMNSHESLSRDMHIYDEKGKTEQKNIQ